jgi:hypothetical protein
LDTPFDVLMECTVMVYEVTIRDAL